MPGEQKTIQEQQGQQTQQQNQQQSQNSQTRPWEFTMDSLAKLRDSFGLLGQDPSYTANLNNAFMSAKNALAGAPNLGGAAAGGIEKLFGSDTSGNVGLMNQGYADLLRNIGGTASGKELDPYATPGFSDAIARMTGDITNRVKSTYNAAGRDPSGAGSFAGSLGKGLTEGIAPVIQSQFNTNNANRFNAADALFRGAGSTATGTAGLSQMPLDNILKAIGASGQLPGLYSQNAMANLGLTQGMANVPWEQQQKWLQSVLPMAALGSSSSGQGTNTGTSSGTSSGTTTKTQPESTFGNILGGGLGLASLFSSPAGGTSAAAGIGSALKSLGPMLAMFSDERLKENIAEVGELNDGQPVYSYNYKGDPMPRIGLMAQEVEKLRPDAVVEIGGYKAVDYGRATERARGIGMVSKYLEAA